jgi:hypothetical protein
VVEPSGLLTEAHLCAAYKQLARTRSFIIPNISAEFGYHFPDRVPHKNVVWSLEVQRTGAATSNSYVVNINVVMADSHSNGRNRQEVSANGITVTVYYNRRRIQRCGYKAKTCISVPGKLAIPLSIDRPSSTSDKATIIVNIPTTAFAPVPALQ